MHLCHLSKALKNIKYFKHEKSVQKLLKKASSCFIEAGTKEEEVNKIIKEFSEDKDSDDLITKCFTKD